MQPVGSHVGRHTSRREGARSWALASRLRFIPLLALVTATATGAGVIVFGPQTYARDKGKPVAVKKTFNVARPTGTYTLRVVNHGVTAAVVWVNGTKILRPRDFTFKHGKAWRDQEW